MPSFEEMQRYYSSTPTIGEQLKSMSNLVTNETFTNSTTYRKGVIYDCNMKPIKEMEFKFLKVKTYSIEKDQVEYMVQFRPGINPEIDFDISNDKKHRFGYYIDIPDENSKEIEKWLIIGKNVSEFVKYNVLKCNWLFEWLDNDRIYRNCWGCVRDRNNYNSGVWSDGFTTAIENQTSFIVPTNDLTREIDYGKRFMITDNPKIPKTYEITKVMDTFPLGILKATLTQSYYNSHVDYCGINEEFFKDDNMHMICNYYKSSLSPVSKNEIPQPISHITWKLSEVNNKLYVNGQAQVIQAIPSETNATNSCEWHIFIDGDDYTNRLYELENYLDIQLDEFNNILTIAAINKDFAKYVVTVKIYDLNKTYYDFVDMEVTI